MIYIFYIKTTNENAQNFLLALNENSILKLLLKTECSTFLPSNLWNCVNTGIVIGYVRDFSKATKSFTRFQRFQN